MKYCWHFLLLEMLKSWSLIYVPKIILTNSKMDSTAVQSLFRKNLTNVMEWKKNVITIQDVTIVSFCVRSTKPLGLILHKHLVHHNYLFWPQYMSCLYIPSLVKMESESNVSGMSSANCVLLNLTKSQILRNICLLSSSCLCPLGCLSFVC